jgi:cell wall-associated NlpC family hydrolase
VTAPGEIRERALYFAEQYAAADTEYVWGGNDPLRTVQVDCSGLVVMCYKYAVVHTNYDLLFWDSTVIDMYDNWSEPTATPIPGDLIFMGEAGTDEITHMSIFVEQTGGNIHFIDSTQKDDIDGVTKRFYPVGDPRFKAFGVMRLKQY